MTKKLLAFTLFALAIAIPPAAAQSDVGNAMYVLEYLWLGSGTNGEQVDVALLLRGVGREENACQGASLIATVQDPNGIADPMEQSVEFNPPFPAVTNISFSMVGPPDSARVLKISDYTHVGGCDLEVFGILKDADGKPIDVAQGDQVLHAKYSGTEGPVGPARSAGIIVGSAALDERDVFGFLLTRKHSRDIFDLVSDETPAGPCESLSLRFTARGSTGSVAPMQFDIQLTFGLERFHAVEVPLSYFGEDLVFVEIETNGGVPSGACDLVMSERHKASNGITTGWYWAQGTSMSSPHPN